MFTIGVNENRNDTLLPKYHFAELGKMVRFGVIMNQLKTSDTLLFGDEIRIPKK